MVTYQKMKPSGRERADLNGTGQRSSRDPFGFIPYVGKIVGRLKSRTEDRMQHPQLQQHPIRISARHSHPKRNHTMEEMMGGKGCAGVEEVTITREPADSGVRHPKVKIAELAD